MVFDLNNNRTYVVLDESRLHLINLVKSVYSTSTYMHYEYLIE
jgi:hypothetical protein